MIHVENGKVKFMGMELILASEVSAILKGFQDMLNKRHSKENADEIFKHVIDVSKMSEEEVQEESKKLLAEIIEQIRGL